MLHVCVFSLCVCIVSAKLSCALLSSFNFIVQSSVLKVQSLHEAEGNARNWLGTINDYISRKMKQVCAK